MTSLHTIPTRVPSLPRHYTHGYVSPPLTFDDMMVPTSPTMLTPVIDSAMKAVMESGPDFFNAEGSELVRGVNDEVYMMDAYSDVYSDWHPELKTPVHNGYVQIAEDLMALTTESTRVSPPLMLGAMTMVPSLSSAPTPQPSPDPFAAGPDVARDVATHNESVDSSAFDETPYLDDDLSTTSAPSTREPTPAPAEDADDVYDGRTLRRGRRARRPPGTFKFGGSSSPTPREQQNRLGARGGSAGKSSSTSPNLSKAAIKAKAMAVVTSQGRVRKRPTKSMSVEDRILYIFGEEAMRLDREAFRIWQSAVTLPELTTSEKQVFKRVRRRLLGRTYAKRSRDRQVAHASAIEEECAQLRKENALIRARITRLKEKFPEAF